MTKRTFDIALGIVLFLLLVLPMAVIAVFIRLTSKGPAVHWSKRVGRNNKIFLMPKFRTMLLSTPQVATHLLAQSSQNYITPIGAFLRKTSLDELPQLWSVLTGDMSFVGPRPALFNQDDLVQLRTECGVEKLRPGITGWAQINGRDELSIPLKVKYDKEYLHRHNLFFDLKIICLTALRVSRADGIIH